MTTNQEGAVAGGDVVGRDKIENNFYQQVAKATKLEKLKAKLQAEIDSEQKLDGLIDRLKSYQPILPDDGIVGLEAKLEKAGRSAQKIQALRMKERFAKLLERWSLYASAQEIFVHVLAIAEMRFTQYISPQIGILSAIELDGIVEERILTPIVEDIGVEVFTMDHAEAMGLIYWLAEQCRIRWHQ